MARLAERLRDPVLWSETSQLVKTVAAAVLAWVIAAQVFGLVQPFLAPWAALLTVHATVYRTLARGAQQVGAAVLGVLVAWAAALHARDQRRLARPRPAGHDARRQPRALRAQSTTAAATALMVLLTGYVHSDSMLLARLLDTAIGIGVGLLINLLVWPPLRDRSAARRVDIIDDRIGDLLTDMAREPRAGRRRGVGRAHARARPRHRRRAGARPPGPRERPAEPAPARGAARAGDRGPRRRSSAAWSRRWPSCAAWPARSGAAGRGRPAGSGGGTC